MSSNAPQPRVPRRRRLAIFCDYAEERWPSMDLVAEMLHERLTSAEHRGSIEAVAVRPPFKRRATLLPGADASPSVFLVDRLLNRFRDYPRFARAAADGFDVFHVADHSYAALVHALPAGRTGVFCHDLDAFRAVLDPTHRRPRWYRALVRHALCGMQRAAVVFHATMEVRRQILARGLVDEQKLVYAPLAAADEFTPEDRGDGDSGIDPRAVEAARGPFLLHVGSCARRKRIDVLLDAFERVRRQQPGVRLVKVGGEWPAELRPQVERLGVVHVKGLDRRSLAMLYRRAVAMVFPSEAEGFGLPVVEALACGAPVVASDIPVLREVGGDAVLYRPVGDTAAWAELLMRLIDGPNVAPSRDVRLARARAFSWSAHARVIAGAYERLG